MQQCDLNCAVLLIINDGRKVAQQIISLSDQRCIELPARSLHKEAFTKKQIITQMPQRHACPFASLRIVSGHRRGQLHSLSSGTVADDVRPPKICAPLCRHGLSTGESRGIYDRLSERPPRLRSPTIPRRGGSTPKALFYLGE